MKTRKIGPFEVSAIGFGCMNLSHAYGVPPSPEESLKLLQQAVDIGITHFDTAALYGFGRNEELVGRALKSHRQQIFLASKCGMQGVDGKRTMDGRPETLRKTLNDSLRRLQTDVIDLYYLHRFDKLNEIPIEDSVGELSRMVEDGKIRAMGLSEVSAETIHRANAVHPVTAVQSEYSPWSRNVEIGVLDACADICASFVAFSPLARGFLTDVDLDPGNFAQKDIRTGMPRFQEPYFSKNKSLLTDFRNVAKNAGYTSAQLCVAWALHKRPYILPIPGTTSPKHLEEIAKAGDILLEAEVMEIVDELINEKTVSGARYPSATQAEIDTEEFS